jgi:type I restriction enzyme S subunit
MSFPRYPKYKDSGVEWLGEVPEHWAVAPLKTVASHNDDVLTEDTPPDYEINYVDISGVEAGMGITTRETMPFSAAPSRARRRVQHGDVIVSTVRTYLRAIARIVAPESNLVVSTGFAAIRPREALCAGFAGYMLSGNHFIEQVIARSTGVSYPAINASELVGIPALLPPPNEQAAIATFLDRETAKIDDLIAEQQRLIELLQEKRQAVISHAVTKGLNPDAPMKDSGIEWLGEVPEHWKTGRCRFYVDMLSGFAFPSQGFSDDEADWRLLRGINVGVGSIRWEDIVYWKREPDDGLDAYEMRQGDLVIGMDRPLISDGMRVARLTEQDVPSLLLQRVVRLTPLPHIDAEYLQHLLSSEMFVAHFAPETTGVSVPHISPDQIAAFVIPVPPIDEQKAIVKQVSQTIVELAGLMNQARQSVDLLQERRSALISAAVTGQIDVRGLAGSEAA